MRWVRLVLCAAFLCWGLPLPARADVAAVDRQATFVIQTVLADGRAGIGAGVAVARSGGVITIATAAHVLIGPTSALRILDTTRERYYEVLAVHELLDYDLALIDVRVRADHAVAPVAVAPPSVGEDVVVLGHHDGRFWTTASGHVVATDVRIPSEFGSARIAIRCDACAHGDSGAGVFDAHGHLIGILTKAWRDPDGKVRFIEVEPAALVAQELAVW